ncbi:MAG: hypothetical protein HOY71_42655, partial [Nonomuraea sp.]|nr:hypothetical protein [Nonomuraea sp.]
LRRNPSSTPTDPAPGTSAETADAAARATDVPSARAAESAAFAAAAAEAAEAAEASDADDATAPVPPRAADVPREGGDTPLSVYEADEAPPTRVNEAPGPRIDETPKTRVNETPRTRVEEPLPYASEPYDRPRPSGGYGDGEAFAPHGPFRPLDPRRRPGYAATSPYDPVLYGKPVPPPRPKRARSFIGAITFLLAIIVGGIVVAVQANSASGVNPTIVGGALLITIGSGLLVAAWWGRGAGLVAAGTTIALLIAFGLMFGGMPRKLGDSIWNPTTSAEVHQLFDVGVGDGRLDLSDFTATPGSTTTINAKVSIGELTVIVPPDVRVQVHASNKVGDIKIDQSLRGGVDVRFDKDLDPEVTPKGAVSTLVLNLKGGVGDMEVRRGA